MSDEFINGDGLVAIKNWTKDYVDNHLALQSQGNWRYRVHPDGTFEAWYLATKQTVTITNTSGSVYRSELTSLTVPTGISDLGNVEIRSFNIGCGHNNYPVWTAVASLSGGTVRYYALSGGSRSQNSNYTITAYIMGAVG